jgi:hypothetical protein
MPPVYSRQASTGSLGGGVPGVMTAADGGGLMMAAPPAGNNGVGVAAGYPSAAGGPSGEFKDTKVV